MITLKKQTEPHRIRQRRHHESIRRRSKGQVEILSTTIGRSVSVIGIISVLAIGAYLMTDAQADATIAEITMIDAAVTSLYGEQSSYKGLTEGNIATSGLISETYHQGTVLRTTWQNEIEIYGVTNPITNIDTGAWKLWIKNVPTAICEGIATHGFLNQIGLSVGSNDVAESLADNSNSQYNFKPLSMNDAVMACTMSAAENGVGAITLMFG